jgi:two-component system, OmpR family, response regulator
MAKKRCRILVVEDDEQVKHLLAEGVSVEGYDVEVVSSGPDALTRDDFATFDVAVVDLSLPGGLDGWSIADYAAGLGLGVVVITGHPDQYHRLLGSGHAFLRKPFRLLELTAQIELVLKRIGSDCERQSRGPPVPQPSRSL